MSTSTEPLVATGIEGFDHILGGGLPRNRFFLVQGDPGTGKTTLALQFLLEGARRGEAGVYITLSETNEELRAVAQSHGWSLDALTLFELGDYEGAISADEQYTLFHPSEVELNEVTGQLLAVIERVKPARVVFDSLSEVRLLARDPLRYRRQLLALKQFFIGRQATVLLLDDGTAGEKDLQLQSLAHGVISLEQFWPEFGESRHRMRVVKMRGVRFRGGYHDFTIETGGLVIYPRLVAAEHRGSENDEVTSTGVAELDALLGGGIHRGTSTVVLGPAGSGKSSITSQILCAAADRGERSALLIFDEVLPVMLARADGLGLPLRRHVEGGLVQARQIDPGELAPGQFTHAVVRAVERDRARIVVIDSLNGYLNATPDERSLNIQLHELFSFLAQRGVITLLTIAQHGLLGMRMESPVDVSYLADSVLLLRFFEARGEVHKAISVLKRRRGGHERAIRELRIRSQRGAGRRAAGRVPGRAHGRAHVRRGAERPHNQ
ncbi:MAG: gas vesicle protein GvpD [Minicystis sp.]